MYAGIFFFTKAMKQALDRITATESWTWLSPGDTVDVLADAMFRVAAPRALPVPAAAAAVVVLLLLSIVVLERRVRGVEVVT
jgi:hypothetical protein